MEYCPGTSRFPFRGDGIRDTRVYRLNYKKKRKKKKCQMNAKIGVNFATSPYDFLSILTFKMLNILHHLGEEYTNVYIFQAEEFWNSQVCFILFFFLFSFSFCV